ncbi:hypothetical protein FERRO_13930 [Ferrovum sp. JA12]|uniref:hypothetical protein n=1 Tax=Ferrovum sp. JA12 TaxID=1356299 RepID=UPI00070389A0|nr:hypothetical protein [Ferrovum sp. JA12]KRH78406.1 hypothetical protein FERRO_13930 [Ferrovum sp. JA12]
MKMISFLFKARGALLALMGGLVLLSSLDANAIPVFARQTGFKCVACHVGGEYPQLTALGRYFKLTGYTQGDAKDIFGEMTTNLDRAPFSVWLQASKQWYANTQPGGINGNAPTSQFSGQTISLFTGGHLTDHVGAFIQWTAAKYDGLTTSSTGPTAPLNWTVSIDNSEVRVADHRINKSGDWIYGAYINNRITMSDVWNTQENWTSDWIGYFNAGFNGVTGLAPTTELQSGSTQHNNVGVGTYLYKDKTWYGELAVYRKVSNGPLSVFTEGVDAGSAPTLNNNLYTRFGYNKEWGPHELFIGLHGLFGSGDPYGVNIGTTANPITFYSSANNQATWQDMGVDAQYQYILDPHYFSAHFRLTHENMQNSAPLIGGTVANANNNLNEYWADMTYIYKAKYGAMLFFHGARGSSDTVLYSSGVSGSPDWDSIMPSIFWSPYQNIRIGLMETFYTRLGGTTSSLITNPVAGSGNLSPHSFNTTMLYGSVIY